MAHLLEVRNLSVGIKRENAAENCKLLKAVNDISFYIDEGEITGLAGESGCGKSLTALSIAGLLPRAAKITAGEISFNGKPHLPLADEASREISVIFQETRQSLNPLMRAGYQITETLELGGSKNKQANKAAALEMLAKLGFDEPERIFNAYPHRLSGGMCQRVMAAIAAISKPRLLLADEPSSSLDLESQNKILSLLVQMNREYKTSILMISHDLSIIQQFCSRYLVMYSGKIVEEGPAASLFSPLHPYTKALIGAIPHKDKRSSNLENIPGKVPLIEDNFPGCPFAPRCQKRQSLCVESFPPAAEINGGKVHCFFPEKGNVNE